MYAHLSVSHFHLPVYVLELSVPRFCTCVSLPKTFHLSLYVLDLSCIIYSLAYDSKSCRSTLLTSQYKPYFHIYMYHVYIQSILQRFHIEDI